MTLQKHRETLTENDIEELISETVKLKEIQVPRAIASRTSCRVESKLFGHENFFKEALCPRIVHSCREVFLWVGWEGVRKFRDLKCQKMPKMDAVWILFCGRNDFRHKGMVV